METLFSLSPEELEEVCTNAEFDKEHQLILQQSNCIQEGNIILLKKPIKTKLGELLAGALDKSVIVKESKDGFFLYLLALAETEPYREELRNYYETNHCDEYDCFGLKCYYTGWKENKSFHDL